MTYDNAWEAALVLRSRADAYEKQAAEFDQWQAEKSGYTQATKDWAKTAQVNMRNRAVEFRALAKKLVEEAA